MLSNDPLNPDSFDLADIQRRIQSGETFTPEQYRRIIESIRSSRTAAVSASKSPKLKKTTTSVDLNKELDELFGIGS